MKKVLRVFFTVLVCFNTAYSQKIKGKIIDATTLSPISNVAIQSTKKSGTFSDVEGLFSIRIGSKKQLKFSCLGYTSRVLSLDSLKVMKFTVKLKTTNQNLEEVVLNFKELSLEKILQQTQSNLFINYKNTPLKQAIHYRKSHKATFKKVDFNLDKNSLLTRKKRKLANKSFDEFSKQLISSNTTSYTDYYTNFYSNNIFIPKLKTHYLTSKVDSCKGYRSTKSTENFTIETVQNNAIKLILKHLNTNLTYKVKTGLFKIEDSLSIKKITKEIDLAKNTFNNFHLKNDIKTSIGRFDILDIKSSSHFLNSKLYTHKLLEITHLKDVKTYVVSFIPRKSKAKFSGKLHINATDFAIHKLSYAYAKGKRGSHLNLKLVLGVKFSEDIKKGVILYKKNALSKYIIEYAKEETGISFYVNRSFKFIGNSSKRNKVKFSAKLVGTFLTTTEMVITKTEGVDKTIFKTKQKAKKIQYLTLKEYNSSLLKSATVFEKFKKI
ncbi:MAG: carboxypeptidase-like regulatory domain-containing protein [Flavobacteriaceae bacterium]|nr:carboxypeptidase-like regulatory domain-containing protein [Flavobacteriaceae bacterium]